MDDQEGIRMLTVLGAQLWWCHLTGKHSPLMQRQCARMRALQVGDLVLELSALYRPHRRFDDAIGGLVAMPVRDVQEDDGTTWQEQHWIVRRLSDGEEVDWTKAYCVALPTTLGEWPPQEEDTHG